MKHLDRIAAALAAALLLPLVVAADPPPTPAPRQAPVRVDRLGPPAEGTSALEAGASEECVPRAVGGAPLQTRRSQGLGFTVDACGRLLYDRESTPRQILPEAVPAPELTIDRMTTRSGYQVDYKPFQGLHLMESADVYTLSDGSSWWSGAGTGRIHSTEVERVEVSGSTIRYVLLTPPYSGRIYEQQDFDSGDHSAQGVLAASGPLVLEATAGSTTAVLRGNALVVENTATWYGPPRFNYYRAVVGSVVPFELTYRMLEGGTWQPDTFQHEFVYDNTGFVDFEHPVSVPKAVELTVRGPGQVAEQSSTPFSAVVRYESGALRSVTAEATWSVDPGTLAEVDHGLVTTHALTGSSQVLTLRAQHVEGVVSLAAVKAVVCRSPALAREDPRAWLMYQANPGHTGHVAISLRPNEASLRWQRTLSSVGAVVNPVTGAEGRVFASLVVRFGSGPSLFALDAMTGATLWSRSFDGAFSVNPPSTAYDTVYVQTGNNGSDTWLHGLDASTGETWFQAPHEAQWERYYAPTIFEGSAYVNGGFYGGLLAFDAFSGERAWSRGLPQYDQWTPAVDANYAYAYVGEYEPGLYVFDRRSGVLMFVVSDPNFVWNGWSMDLAPVLGGHDDVLVIHDGRLIRFDLPARSISWEEKRAFVGQPSVDRSRVYAVDGGRVVVLDEMTGGEVWSWEPPAEAPIGPILLTDHHFLVSTSSHVYAVDLAFHATVWSYPVAGHLALADGNLYVASGQGVLTAIAMPNSLRPQRVWQDFFAVDRRETPYTGDFDGDGKTDVITFTRENPVAVGDVYVALSEGTRFGPSRKWHDWFAVDHDETVVIGDYDGDGRDDVATWLGRSTGQVYVARSEGTGFAPESVWLSSIGGDDGDILLSGDANGDGKADLILFARLAGEVYVSLSTGSGFAAPGRWHSFFAVSLHERPRVADLDGDGKTDIVTFASDSPTAFGDVYVALSDGSRFGDGHNSTKWHDWFAIRPEEEIRVGDLNADGKDDFFTFLPPPFAQCYTVLSQGSSMGPNVLWPEAVAPQLGAGDTVAVGDVNGDGRADVIIFAQGEGKVYVSLAS